MNKRLSLDFTSFGRGLLLFSFLFFFGIENFKYVQKYIDTYNEPSCTRPSNFTSFGSYQFTVMLFLFYPYSFTFPLFWKKKIRDYTILSVFQHESLKDKDS